jgi:hypothetical protein
MPAKGVAIMRVTDPRVTTVAALAAGTVLGWFLGGRPSPVLRAEGGDRFGETIVTSGSILTRYDERLKATLKQDAVYFLDYKGGRLLGMIPSYQQVPGSTRLIDTFAERDLVADFKLNVETGARPHFLMTTCEMGQYSLGWAPLFVFETTTNQVAVYRIQQQSIGTASTPAFELIEVRPIGSGPQPPLPRP